VTVAIIGRLLLRRDRFAVVLGPVAARLLVGVVAEVDLRVLLAPSSEDVDEGEAGDPFRVEW
jgi:hypothetical protein